MLASLNRVASRAAPRVTARPLSFLASDLAITLNTAPKVKPDPDTLKFGEKFSDHMLEIDWTQESGWGKPRISAFANLSVSPAITGLHYGIQCFEGMKCYHSPKDDSLRLFRPDMNMKRLNSSMNRLAMPEFDSEQMTELIKKFCEVESDWVPKGQGYSLYLRPTAIGTHPFLGVDVSKEVKLYVIASPVGPYYRTGFNPVSLYADTENKRACPGGVGAFKVGGNYGSTIAPAKEAMAKGYNQVLWMWGDDDEVTECGAMNLFFVLLNEEGKKELWTAPLTRGDILPGVTRDSILSLARNKWDDITVREEFPNMKQIRKAGEEGRLLESFGAGTAAVVAPINKIFYDGKDIEIPATGEITQRIWDELNGIYYGEEEGPEGWSVKV